MPDVWFPNLGIEIDHLDRTFFSIGNFSVAWYGFIIMIGFLLGFLLCMTIAKKSGQNSENYVDFFIYAVIGGILGARLYYVLFSWDYYSAHPSEIIAIWNGGLAIYGGIIADIIIAFFFCRHRKLDFALLLDTCLPCVALGQAIGRWGNFMNQEAFGGYCDGLFAMRLNIKTAYYLTPELLDKAITVNGTTYIQVHPTFLYESFGCLMVLLLMLLMWKFKKFNGQAACSYFIGYGIVRAFVEPLRTDQLLLWNTNIPVSVVVSVGMILLGVVLMIVLAFLNKRKEAVLLTEQPDKIQPQEEGANEKSI